MGAPDFLDERSSKLGLFFGFWRESSEGGRMSLGRDLLGILSWTYIAHVIRVGQKLSMIIRILERKRKSIQ